MSNILPIFARVQLSKDRADGLGLWVPLFLLWPLWFFALGLFCLALMAITLTTGSHAFAAAWGATRALHHTACALRGVDCEVRGHGGLVHVTVW